MVPELAWGREAVSFGEGLNPEKIHLDMRTPVLQTFLFPPHLDQCQVSCE